MLPEESKDFLGRRKKEKEGKKKKKVKRVESK